MRVSNHDLTGLGAAGADRAQETARSGGSASGSASGADGGDRVDFSSALGSLSRALSSFGASQSGTVQGLSAQYQAGNYATDGAAISRGLIAEAMGD
jgi:hypothetical protein